MRVVGFVVPFAARGQWVVPGGNSFYRTPGGKWAQERYATGVTGKAQRRDLVGIVEGSSGVPSPRGQYSGKIRVIEKPGVLDVGGSPCG